MTKPLHNPIHNLCVLSRFTKHSPGVFMALLQSQTKVTKKKKKKVKKKKMFRLCQHLHVKV